MTDIKQALFHAKSQLEKTSDSVQLDAEVLLSHLLKKSRTFIHAHPEYLLDSIQWETFKSLINQRASGIPIAYLTGTKEFWSLSLKVNKHTLIPRPETELIVELVLKLAGEKKTASVLDLGTGTGAIAIALAKERPEWKFLASDVNPEAVEIARENIQHLGLTNVSLSHSNWFSDIKSHLFDVIVSNPPYLAEGDPHLLQEDIRHEPYEALVSGEKGLDALYQIIFESYEYLAPGGLLLVEHGYEQKNDIISMFIARGYHPVRSWHDWQGHDRVCGGWRKK